MKKSVLVLAGGPDKEREASLRGAATFAGGLRESGRVDVRLEEIGAITARELRSLPGDVNFPALHGPGGAGGPVQTI